MADDPDKAERDRIFNHFDTNGDGKISAGELSKALKVLDSVTMIDIKKLIDKVDTDGDGYISYQEYTDFACANPTLMRDVAKMF